MCFGNGVEEDAGVVNGGWRGRAFLIGNSLNSQIRLGRLEARQRKGIGGESRKYANGIAVTETKGFICQAM